MSPIGACVCLLACVTAWPAVLRAAPPDAEPGPVWAALRLDADFLHTESFLSAHPDQYFRLRGAQAHAAGHDGEARRYFRLAARFADKSAQAAYAEMLWDGHGGPRDRALAYAWMDLAAERGTPLLLARRERYWDALDAAERTRAIRDGQAVYAEFADDVAKPRLERRLRLARNNVTGSRTGAHPGNMDIVLRNRDGGTLLVRADRYYNARYWEPAQYWALQDAILADPPRGGQVEIGPIDALEGAPPEPP